METSSPVIVTRLPESLTVRQARGFLDEVQPLLQRDRPQLVFDLCQLRRIDAAGIELLVRCLQEVARRDGDLKLAALTPQAHVMLELTRTARLFEIHATAAEAVSSFSGYLPKMVRQFYRKEEAEPERSGGRKAA
jgi:anti-anti-sigma factor